MPSLRPQRAPLARDWSVGVFDGVERFLDDGAHLIHGEVAHRNFVILEDSERRLAVGSPGHAGVGDVHWDRRRAARKAAGTRGTPCCQWTSRPKAHSGARGAIRGRRSYSSSGTQSRARCPGRRSHPGSARIPASGLSASVGGRPGRCRCRRAKTPGSPRKCRCDSPQMVSRAAGSVVPAWNGPPRSGSRPSSGR